MAGSRTVVVEDRRAGHRPRGGRGVAGDVVLLAGKGHEDYQEVAGVRHPFSTPAEARAALMQRGGPPDDDAWPRPTRCCRGSCHAGGRRRHRASRVHSDTRTLQPGDLFVALQGRALRRHDFLPTARARRRRGGAGAARPGEAGLPGLQVADTRTR
jgi:UDP-N-acetylmuramyl tripeptide synthase